MRLGLDQAPLLAATRRAVEGEGYDLAKVIAIDIFIRR